MYFELRPRAATSLDSEVGAEDLGVLRDFLAWVRQWTARPTMPECACDLCQRPQEENQLEPSMARRPH
jgi:hypothetical protein